MEFNGTICYICTIPMLYEPFVSAMVQMVQYTAYNGPHIYYNRSTVGSQADARNTLVDEIQGDWLLMLDTDMVFTPSIVVDLLEIADKNKIDVLTGLYYQRRAPYYPLAYRQVNEKFLTIDPSESEHPVIPIDGAGGGCLFVRRKVFDRIKNELKEKPFTIIGSLGEDLSVFSRLKKLEIHVYLAKDIKLEHLTLQGITRKDYLEYNKS